MSSIVSTSIPAAGAVVPENKRLIDLDGNRYILFKKVIVIGHPGSGTDAIVEALKKLNFNVYDGTEACKNHERDFPLWLEAAKAKKDGVPYGRREFDKLTGRYDVLAGAPATFFADDLVKAYSDTKYIVVGRKPSSAVLKHLLRFIDSPLLSRLDPEFFGKMAAFLDPMCKNSTSNGFDSSAIRKNRLLEINQLTSWKALCEFVDRPIPKGPVPVMHDSTITSELAKRARKVVKDAIDSAWLILIYLFMALAVGLAAFLFGRRLLLFTFAVSVILAVAASLGLFTYFNTVYDTVSTAKKSKVERLILHVNAPVATPLPSPVTAGPAPKVEPKVTPKVTAKVPPKVGPKTHQNRRPAANQAAGNKGRWTQNNRQGRQAPNNRPASRPVAPRPVRPAQPAANPWANFESKIRNNDMETCHAILADEAASKDRPRAAFEQTSVVTDRDHASVAGPRKVKVFAEEQYE